MEMRFLIWAGVGFGRKAYVSDFLAILYQELSLISCPFPSNACGAGAALRRHETGCCPSAHSQNPHTSTLCACFFTSPFRETWSCRLSVALFQGLHMHTICLPFALTTQTRAELEARSRDMELSAVKVQLLGAESMQRAAVAAAEVALTEAWQAEASRVQVRGRPCVSYLQAAERASPTMEADLHVPHLHTGG